MRLNRPFGPEYGPTVSVRNVDKDKSRTQSIIGFETDRVYEVRKNFPSSIFGDVIGFIGMARCSVDFHWFFSEH